jgi:ribosome-binding factor A
VADALPDNARVIDDLLVRAAAADAEVHRVAAGAAYAGDADPYRSADDTDEAVADEAGSGDTPTSSDPAGDARA